MMLKNVQLEWNPLFLLADLAGQYSLQLAKVLTMEAVVRYAATLVTKVFSAT